MAGICVDIKRLDEIRESQQGFFADYLFDLIKYNKILLQRNKLLKDFANRKYYESDSLDVWDDQLVLLGENIFKKREKCRIYFTIFY